MKNLQIKRKTIEDTNSIGGINQEIESITFQPEKGNKLDDVIYYLICTQEKLQSSNLVENALASSRLDLALVKLKNLIEDVENNDIFFKKVVLGQEQKITDEEEPNETKL